MGGQIGITRADYSAAGLRALAGKADDGVMVRRLLALAMVLEGRSREEAASLNAMTRQTLRDWVHRYNAAWLPWRRATMFSRACCIPGGIRFVAVS